MLGQNVLEILAELLFPMTVSIKQANKNFFQAHLLLINREPTELKRKFISRV